MRMFLKAQKSQSIKQTNKRTQSFHSRLRQCVNSIEIDVPNYYNDL